MAECSTRPPSILSDEGLAQKKREILTRTVIELSRQTRLVSKNKASIRMINALSTLYKNLTNGDEFLDEEDTEQLTEKILEIAVIKDASRRKGKG